MHQSKQCLSEYECDKDDIVWSMCIWCMWCWSRWYQVKYYLLGGIFKNNIITNSYIMYTKYTPEQRRFKVYFFFFCFFLFLVFDGFKELFSPKLKGTKIREMKYMWVWFCESMHASKEDLSIWQWDENEIHMYVIWQTLKKWCEMKHSLRWCILKSMKVESMKSICVKYAPEQRTFEWVWVW